jgi:hypothetical protein
MENWVPVFNSAPAMEKTMVFSVPEVDGTKKRFPYKQAKAMLEATKGGRLSINAETFVEEVKPEDVPNTLPWLLSKTGANSLLGQYESAVRRKEYRKANDLEAKLFAKEKDVKENKNLPESLRKSFVNYVEKRIETIDDKYSK